MPFTIPPAVTPSGNLSYARSIDFTGQATVDVYLRDDGGTDNGGADLSALQSFMITSGPLSDTDLDGVVDVLDPEFPTQPVRGRRLGTRSSATVRMWKSH